MVRRLVKHGAQLNSLNKRKPSPQKKERICAFSRHQSRSLSHLQNLVRCRHGSQDI